MALIEPYHTDPQWSTFSYAEWAPAPKPERPMRVKDLIEKLQSMDPDLVIRNEQTGDLVTYIIPGSEQHDHIKRGNCVWLGFEA